ncbi:tyrosine-protein kinase transmembrane receptor Ror-like [Limulus polyphemus]|uniref:Tyrosine-protein kinase transmembrane receptor Ror-like n=1 Tax=Limulus polyphemus TaxID=6850 RepID=A0ABM1SH13_LIMPO|nr:tyrosine-protein kinase transmembrane receptor Ror-like [Limulus polyphemus]
MIRDLEIPGESLTFMELIGEGCFSEVYKGEYVQTTGDIIPVAVKVLKDNLSIEVHSDFEREVKAMATFDHENILKLLGVVLKEAGSVPCMVFEFMQYGDLGELLRNNDVYIRQPSSRLCNSLTQVDLVPIATQIARGMAYLSSLHFVHRDLATRNCLVGENLMVKISDFGMSRDIYTCDYYKIGGSRMLPVRWMAPESMMYGKFTLDSDVWSYGVVLWEIFTFGKQPYYGHSNEEVVKLILQGILLSPPGKCPYFIYNIMAGCWKTEPRDRLKFSDIYQILMENTPSASQHPAYFNHDVEEDLTDLFNCHRSDLEQISRNSSVFSIVGSLPDAPVDDNKNSTQPAASSIVGSTRDIRQPIFSIILDATKEV